MSGVIKELHGLSDWRLTYIHVTYLGFPSPTMDEFERAAAAFPDLDDTFSPSATQPIGGGGFPSLEDEDDFGMPATAPGNPSGAGLDDGDGFDEFERATSAFPALDGNDGPANAPSLEVRTKIRRGRRLLIEV
jgi:hypothetical protein